VDNAAHAHLLAADALTSGSPAAGSAYFISQGQPVNCWQWIDRILALAGLPPVRRSMTLKMAWRIGLVCEVLYAALRIHRDPPMTRFLAAQLATNHYYDISRARRELGYQPQVSTEEGMQRLGRELATGGTASPLANNV
jgi:nucleoside-diphosphate-sugar epimerase